MYDTISTSRANDLGNRLRFASYRLAWRMLSFYILRIRKMRHPVSGPYEFGTKIPGVKVIAVPAFWDNYSYILTSGREAVAIDPSEYKPLADEIEKRNLRLSSIVVTHEHIDHAAGALELRDSFGVPLYVPNGAAIPGQTRRAGEGQRLSLGETSIEALCVPGHHSFPYPLESLHGNIAWYCEQAEVLFSGDTLFPCGYGYVAKGFERPMFESLRRLRSLPDETRLFCGHEYALRTTASAALVDWGNGALQYRLSEVRELAANCKPAIPTTILHEKTVNPWLRWDDVSLKAAFEIDEADDFKSFMRMQESWRRLQRTATETATFSTTLAL
jgi:hydroxyacylglutathione hydrolase